MTTRTTALIATLLTAAGAASAAHTIDIATLRDKVKGGWVGQMVGVQWGIPYEFRPGILADSVVADYSPRQLDTCGGVWQQDDLQADVPFVRAMREASANCSWVTFGEYFRNTTSNMWIANQAARTNLQAGIAAPNSGHYLYNNCQGAIDWMIDADFAGIVAPGMVGAAIDVGWRAGHVVNYGDGAYGGAWVAAMHAAAYFAGSAQEIVEAGRQAVPMNTGFRTTLERCIAARQNNPTDWTRAWQIDHSDAGSVMIGLQYGGGDFEQSMRLAVRCGGDCDCYPSTVGGIIGTMIGYNAMPAKFKAGLSTTTSFVGVGKTYTLDSCVEASVAVARAVVLMRGGSVSGSGSSETWTIPDQPAVVPVIVEQTPPTTWSSYQAPQLTVNAPVVSGRSVTFSATATTSNKGIRAWQWYFGDFAYASGQSVTHDYATSATTDTFDVICFVADSFKVTSQRMIQVIVPAGVTGTAPAATVSRGNAPTMTLGTRTVRFGQSLRCGGTLEVFDAAGRSVARQTLVAGARSAALPTRLAHGVLVARVKTAAGKQALSTVTP